MFNSWKALSAHRIDEVDPKFAFPLLRWMSGKPENLAATAYINELFFKVPPTVVISLLSVNCKGGFFKYPKATKEEKSAKEELLKEKIKQLYKWSDSEYEKNKTVVNLIDVNEINKIIGLDKKECKILGVEYGERKYKFVADKPKPAGLDAFM